MKQKVLRAAYVLVCAMIVVLLFAMGDYLVHALEDAWSVPDYYFRNKIPYGFLWALVGLLIARKAKSVWAKGAIVSAVISIALQSRYFYEGYALDFVLLFLLFHFLIILVPAWVMFYAFEKSAAPELPGQGHGLRRLAIAVLILAVAAVATKRLIFSPMDHHDDNAAEEQGYGRGAYPAAELDATVEDGATDSADRW
jgi:hypothetical protein